MPSSRAVIVLGMHRSGTSVLTRGLQSLGVFLGDEFLNTQPDNPTGYWEDRVIVGLNERLLDLFGLDWESISLIQDTQWHSAVVAALQHEAVVRLQSHFMTHALWGFKDPRTLRLLPFWRAVFQSLDVDDRYVLAIRNPISVATSLLRRQSMPPATSHMISLVYLVPHLHEIADRPFVVVDYDLLVADPREQLARVRRALELPFGAAAAAAIDRFSTDFLDPGLRHAHARQDDFDAIPYLSPLIREAYIRLCQLATDQLATDSPAFWNSWKRIRAASEELITSRAAPEGLPPAHSRQIQGAGAPEAAPPAAADEAGQAGLPEEGTVANQPSHREFPFRDRTLFHGTGVRFFVVIAAQCTGTNLLREILNTNPRLAMLGEILFPNPAPAHWENFLKGQAPGAFPTWEPRATEDLLDRYFDYVLYRIRNHWLGGDKSGCRAIGVDIRYNQLRLLAPVAWNSRATPFLLSYLRSREATLIHVTRRNVIHSALSALVAAKGTLGQDDENAAVDRRFALDPTSCLEYARRIVRDGGAFLDDAKGCKVVECCYEDLTEELAGAAAGGELPERPGPLRDIARALEVPFGFRYDGRLQKAINVPCFKVLSNLEELSEALKESEFSALAATLGEPG
jgi:LPS sulfotransferase NodH